MKNEVSVPLQCECGSVSGEALEVSKDTGTRLLCYCNDCQAFARFLGNEKNILDDSGGTDIFQMDQAHLNITEGLEKIRCVRLSNKGMFRWYTDCCRTPIGNTLGPGMPFVGVIHNFMQHQSGRDNDLGLSRGNVWVKYAAQEALEDIKKSEKSLVLLLRTLRKLLVWKMRGLGQPSPFFDEQGKPVSEPEILTS